MNQIIRILLIFVVLFSNSCFAKTKIQLSPSVLPEDLTFKKLTIDPLCFSQEENSNNVVSLTQCGINWLRSAKKLGYDKKRIKKGFIGYNYSWEDENGTDLEGYSYYKIIGTIQDAYLVYLLYSEVGNGDFSAIKLATRKDNKLIIETLRTGDRCNGGIESVKLEGGILSYNVNLTPYDFLEMTRMNPKHLLAFNDLSACPTCCVAKAQYQRDINAIGKEKLIAVDLGSNTDEESSLKQGTYQECFNQLLAKYKKLNRRYLKTDDLFRFVKQFNYQCVNVGTAPAKN